MRRSQTKLIARRVVLALTLGLATTIVVAAICARCTTQHPFFPASRSGERLTDPRGVTLQEVNGKAPPGTQYMELSLYEAPGVTFGMSRLRPFQNYTPAAPPPTRTPPESVAHHWERVELLPWLDGHRSWPDPKVGESIWVKAAGWPFRALVCEPHATNAPNFATHTWTAKGGLIIGNATFPGWADWPPMIPVLIPLRPMWPELLLDTGFYAIGWSLVCFPVISLRRVVRIRRGHCPECNYNLAGLIPDAPCPECGLDRT